jgi:hypothetical protein
VTTDGFDYDAGFGLVNAVAALKSIAAE